MRPQLCYDARAQEVMSLLMHAPAPSWQAKLAMGTIMEAGIGLLPDWAQQMTGHSLDARRQAAVDRRVRIIATLLRWAVRNGAWPRAMRRMGRHF